MEKFFNFFRFTNQNVNVFETSNTLSLAIINSDGRVVKLEAFTNTTAAEVISSALFEFAEISENDYRGHQLIHVRSGNVLNYNTSMKEASVLDNGKDDVLAMII